MRGAIAPAAGLVLWTTMLTGVSPAQSSKAREAAADSRVVVVELFSSQGCDLCPKAEELFGTLAQEFGPDRIAPVAFHVDYFDEPWKDPFSDHRNSQRQEQYSRIYARERGGDASVLYLTPLIMVNGRVPMVGSNEEAPAVARKAIREALSRPAEVAVNARLDANRGNLIVEVAPRNARMAGKSVLVEVVTTQDDITTEVRAGELNGKTYRARHVARAYDLKRVDLPRANGMPETLEFNVERKPEWKADGLTLLVIIQDEKTGQIYQAQRLAWPQQVAPGPEAMGPEREVRKRAR